MRAAETARAGLAAATKAARAWHDDAFLCELLTYGADGGGIAKIGTMASVQRPQDRRLEGAPETNAGWRISFTFPMVLAPRGWAWTCSMGRNARPCPAISLTASRLWRRPSARALGPEDGGTQWSSSTPLTRKGLSGESAEGEPCWVGASEPAERKEPTGTAGGEARAARGRRRSGLPRRRILHLRRARGTEGGGTGTYAHRAAHAKLVLDAVHRSRGDRRPPRRGVRPSPRWEWRSDTAPRSRDATSWWKRSGKRRRRPSTPGGLCSGRLRIGRLPRGLTLNQLAFGFNWGTGSTAPRSSSEGPRGLPNA